MKSSSNTASPRRRVAVSSIRLLPEMFALSLFNNILPSRSGELSFPYFMKKRHGMAVGESTAALLVVRIFDYLAVALLYVLFALLYLDRLTANATPVVLAVAVMLLVSLVILAAMPWLGRLVLRLTTWLMVRLGLVETRASHLLLRATARAVEAFERMRTPRTYVLTFGWSLLTWLATFAWFAAFMRALGLGMPYPLVIVGGTFAMLAKAIPFITIGGFGAHEVGWALGFRLVGMEIGVAIASGFAVNILTLVASVVFGGAALIFMRMEGRGRQVARKQGNKGEGDEQGVWTEEGPPDERIGGGRDEGLSWTPVAPTTGKMEMP